MAAKLLRNAPVLLVRDVFASAAYWKEKLGFDYDRIWGNPPAFCILQRDGASVMLQQAPPDHAVVPHWQVVPQMWNVYIWVDRVDELYAEAKSRGARIDYELHDKPYGCREFGVQDLDGHDIAFGQIL